VKKKDIILLSVSLIVILVSVYFSFGLLFPSNEDTTADNATKKEKIVPSSIDETGYKSVETLSDYGKPNLDGIGKSDLFESGAGSYVPPAKTSAPAATAQTNPAPESNTDNSASNTENTTPTETQQ
jgi:hypothetical protein